MLHIKPICFPVFLTIVVFIGFIAFWFFRVKYCFFTLPFHVVLYLSFLLLIILNHVLSAYESYWCIIPVINVDYFCFITGNQNSMYTIRPKLCGNLTIMPLCGSSPSKLHEDIFCQRWGEVKWKSFLKVPLRWLNLTEHLCCTWWQHFVRGNVGLRN